MFCPQCKTREFVGIYTGFDEGGHPDDWMYLAAGWVIYELADWFPARCDKCGWTGTSGDLMEEGRRRQEYRFEVGMAYYTLFKSRTFVDDIINNLTTTKELT